MKQKAEIFEKNYAEYCKRLNQTNLVNKNEILGVSFYNRQLCIPFFDITYLVSQDGIIDEEGNRPDYVSFVILSQYVLLCPEVTHQSQEYVAFRDFKKASHFTNVMYLHSDTELPIINQFAGQKDKLLENSLLLGGRQSAEHSSYDVACSFQALPKISLLLLFNDRDEDFPAECSVLFQKHAEHYLDPESLAMTSAMLARKLTSMT